MIWAQNVLTKVLIEGRQKDQSQRRKYDNGIMRERERGGCEDAMPLALKNGGSPKPRNAGGSGGWKRQGKSFSPRKSGRAQPCRHTDARTSEL